MRTSKLTYIAVASEEIWDIYSVDVVDKAARSLVILATIDEKLLASALVDEWTDKSPKNWKDAWSTYNK